MNGLSGSHSADDPRDTTLPLWRRTQLRLQNMETWSAQRRNTSDGFDERIQLQDQRIALASRHLVLLLRSGRNGCNELSVRPFQACPPLTGGLDSVGRAPKGTGHPQSLLPP